MKIKENFIIREIAGMFVVVPTGSEAQKFNGMMTINETAAFIWNVLKNGAERDDVVEALLNEYEVDRATAEKDTDEVIKLLESYNVFE